VLRDVVERLDRAGLPYMLTGSLALAYYAEPRMTRDIDLVVALKPEGAAGFTAAVTPDYYVPEDLDGAIAREGFFNLLHLDTVTKVDIIVRRNTPYRLNEFERRRQVTVAGVAIWIVSKEDLILSKLDWARDSKSGMQLQDIRNLTAGAYDRPYVEEWVNQLGLEGLWSEVRDA
jgi:hypothetical protein